ncbi:MAG: AAA family ATPase, partial [Methanosphaera sp. rholeuAM270]
RIQCTPDLLPSDIVGTQVYNDKTREFETVLGPAFANFVLLDEINRSSAKTQSAMLELMQERQATIGGVTYKVPDNAFMVIATQNPIEQEGTYPLSEAQMDRFMFKETLMYPSADEEKQILDLMESGILEQPHRVVSLENVMQVQQIAKKVFVADAVKSYIALLVEATRFPGRFMGGKGADYVKMAASPRASISLLAAAKTTALMNGRAYVIPEDVKANRYRVFRHRIAMNYSAKVDNITVEQFIDAIFEGIPTP